MSVVRQRIFRNAYRDSVELMRIASEIERLPGVDRAGLVMATPANLMRVLGRLCTTVERDAFVEFYETRSSKYLGGSQIYAQAKERIDLCIAARTGSHVAGRAAQAKRAH